jgi:hypothetical protein
MARSCGYESGSKEHEGLETKSLSTKRQSAYISKAF